MQTHDVRQALRIFRREPAFAVAAVLTLDAGHGANTALFAVVEAVLLRPLPFDGPTSSSCSGTATCGTGLTKPDIAIGDFIDLRARQQSLESLGRPSAASSRRCSATVSRTAWRAPSSRPMRSPRSRIQPALGRLLRRTTTRARARAPVGDGQRRVLADRAGIGSAGPDALHSTGRDARVVVGVVPPGFRFRRMPKTDVDRPAGAAGGGAAPSANPDGSTAIGRLHPGDDVARRAGRDGGAISQQFEREFPAQNQGSRYEAAAAARHARRRHPAAADAAARRGRVRPADRVRQRRQPAARAIAGAAAGAGDPRSRSARAGSGSSRRCSPKGSCSRWPAALAGVRVAWHAAPGAGGADSERVDPCLESQRPESCRRAAFRFGAAVDRRR